ncbi:hypothetical protein KP509_07G072800 [Ceratopteris richardii]|uniref:RING-type E3 ubiquitin transferase n=1 Tax=Ceratopteris richardii TaxID=49495 RepID=A0A8T2UJ26_CERRI|nr:hypothetical protein KP509_07G072800 [Ceratopteris richardii]
MYRDTAYAVAAHRGYWACAAILNPSAAEPMVWPSPLKFMQELEPETRSTLQAALAQVNKARFNVPSQIISASPNKSMASLLLKKVFCAHFEKTSLYDDQSRDKTQEQPSMRLEDVGSGCFTCCICFENYHKMIEVDACGHQMCAACTMALCCLNKPNPSASPSTPSCPFCRQDIAHLRLAKAPCNKKVTPFPITPDGNSSQPADRRCKSLGRNISFSLKRRSSISFYL